MDGSTAAQVNWTTMKNKHNVMEVHPSIEGNQGDFSDSSEIQALEENSCKKGFDYSTAMVVYGLPHIVLSN